MKIILICASIVSVLTAAANAQNADITWQTPTAISGPSDVSTLGTYFASWAPYNQDSYNNGGSGLVVNGVKFRAQSDFQGLNVVNFNNGYTSYNNPGTSDANYNDLLQSAAYNGNGDGSALSLTWGGMSPGHTYLVQIWANDGRGNGRSETLTGGSNTSASLVFGNNPGEYIIGTFVADNTGSETISISGAGSVNGPYPQLNFMQVRDITTTPNITWQTPTPISGPSDVNTLGTYFASWAPFNQDSYNNGASGLAVNGVNFRAQSDFQGLSVVNFNSGYTSFNNPGTSDANYNDLMQSAAYNGIGDGSPLSFTWGGMTPGHTYLVQIWANDGRGNGRSQTLIGGANTSASLVFGNNPGEYIIGTFVADNTGSQTVSISGVGSVNGPSPQLNLIQVRDITPMQPRITSVSVSGTTLNISATNGAVGAQYVLFGTTNVTLPLIQWTPILTNNFDGGGNLNLSTNILNTTVPRQFFILSQ